MFHIRIRQPPAAFQLDVENLGDLRRVSLQDHIFRAVSAAPKVRRAGTKLGHENTQRRRRGRHMRQPPHVFRPLRLQLLSREPFARRPRERGPGKPEGNDRVRAELADAAQHVFIQPVDHRAHGNHGRNADDDAENRQRRTQWIDAERVHRQCERLAEVHRASRSGQLAQTCRPRPAQGLADRRHCSQPSIPIAARPLGRAAPPSTPDTFRRTALHSAPPANLPARTRTARRSAAAKSRRPVSPAARRK